MPSTSYVSETFTCEECGHSCDVPVVLVANVLEDPALRDQVVQLEPFYIACPRCGAQHTLDHSLHYVDPDARISLFYPAGQDWEAQADAMYEEFADVEDEQAQSVAVKMNPALATRQRIVSSPADLAEKLVILYAGLDDRYIEINKYLLSLAVEEQEGVAPTDLVFEEVDEQAGEIRYGVLFDQDVDLLTTPRAGYDDLLKSDELRAAMGDAPYAFFVDRAWAEGVVAALAEQPDAAQGDGR